MRAPRRRRLPAGGAALLTHLSCLVLRAGRLAFLEHLQHPVGDHEPADDVRGAEHDRREPDPARQEIGIGGAGDQDRADDHDPVNRVRSRHERRVEQRRHLRDHLEAEEDREREDRELDDELREVAHAATSRRVTHVADVISSSQSSASSPFGARCPSSEATLRAYSWLAWNGIVLGRFSGPTIVTPPASTTSPGRVSSQFPPVSAARSTITDPSRIFSTAAAGTSLGAGRPGMAAVVMTASKSGIRSSSASCCRSCSSGVSSRAYPPSVSSPTIPRSRNDAPSDITCSRVAGRMSKPDTTPPSRRAVAIACSPATPAPSTSTFAGAIVPAAVVSIGRNLGSRSAAMSAALYPATVACDESASIDCARLMRGIDSIAKPRTPAAVRRSIPSWSVSGCRNATTTCPSASRRASSAVGAATFATASTPVHASSTTAAPAASYASSENPAASPAL